MRRLDERRAVLDIAGNALVYLDGYGPDNGATRIVTGSHRPDPLAPPFDVNDESRSPQVRRSS